MPLLSDKIIQLLSCEAQLEQLKKEIVAEHEEILKETEGQSGNLSDILKHKIEEYESVSAIYNELFSHLLQDSTQMKEAYTNPKEDRNT